MEKFHIEAGRATGKTVVLTYEIPLQTQCGLRRLPPPVQINVIKIQTEAQTMFLHNA